MMLGSGNGTIGGMAADVRTDIVEGNTHWMTGEGWRQASTVLLYPQVRISAYVHRSALRGTPGNAQCPAPRSQSQITKPQPQELPVASPCPPFFAAGPLGSVSLPLLPAPGHLPPLERLALVA